MTILRTRRGDSPRGRRATLASVAVATAVGLMLGLASCSTQPAPPPPSSADPSPDAGNPADPLAPRPLPETESVSIGVSSTSEAWLPLLLAVSRDEFAHENLQVELVITDPGDQMAALATGRLDATAFPMTVSVLNAIASGAGIQFVLPLTARGQGEPNGWWIRKDALGDDGEFQLADLYDRQLGTPVGATGTPPATLVTQALDEDPGFDVSRLEFVAINTADSPIALTNGAVDAAFLSSPFWTMVQESECCEFIDFWTDEAAGMILFGDRLRDDRATGLAVLRSIARVMVSLEGDYHADPAVRAEMIEVMGTTEEAIDAAPPLLMVTDFVLPYGFTEFQRYYRTLEGVLSYPDDLSAEEIFDSSFGAELRGE